MQQHVTDFCDGGETSCVPNITVVSGVDKWGELKNAIDNIHWVAVRITPGQAISPKESNQAGAGRTCRVQIDFQQFRLLTTEAMFAFPKVQFEKFSSDRLLSEVINSSSWSFFLWTVNIANYWLYRCAWKRTCTGQGNPVKPQTLTGRPKAASQSLKVKGDPLPSRSFLPPDSFVLSPTSNVQICRP